MATELDRADEDKDISDMTLEELSSARTEVEALIAQMEGLEPESSDDDYGAWADEMENLEDLLDDILDETDRRKRKKK
jgi:uncharacterized protein YukE